MARTSVKQDKHFYQIIREELNLSREKASELLETISEDKLEKMENGKCTPHPEDILIMADKYNEPNICNYYCSTQCPIGELYVPQIKIKELPTIILEMIASLNAMNNQKERLIEIAADGEIDAKELEDFIDIQEQLERISITVETLQLWSERMIATGKIDIESYNKCKEKRKASK